MSLLDILGFSLAMFLLAITPGVGVFATVSRAISNGFFNASFVVLGIVLGDVIFLLLAIFGLSIIASILGEFFIVVKYLGGVYLIYLGYKIFKSRNDEVELNINHEISWKKNFLAGLFITLGNPKAILFYLGFLPTFVNLEILSIFDIFIITSIVIIVLGSVMLAYAYSASSATKLFKSKKAQRNMNLTASGIMLSVGSYLILKQ